MKYFLVSIPIALFLMGFSIGHKLLTPINIKVSLTPYKQVSQLVEASLNKSVKTNKLLNQLLALEINQETKKIQKLNEVPTFAKVKKNITKHKDLEKTEFLNTKVVITNLNIESDFNEIDNNEFISSIVFESVQENPTIVWSDYSLKLPVEKIAEVVNKDEVKTILSAPVKTENVDIQNNVFLEPNLKPLSQSVKLALNREIDRPDQITPVPINPIAFNANPTLEGIKALMKADATDKKSYRIVATHTQIDKGFEEAVDGMDMVMEYDKSELLNSNHDGEIEVETNLNGDYGLMRGTLLAKGYMRTKLDIHLESNQSGFLNVPLLDEYSFYKFMEKENVDTSGGHLLLEVGERVKDADIDQSYAAKIYIDKNFKVVEGAPAPFILFVGVRPGNALLTLDLGKKMAEKIVQISEEELLFTEVSTVSGDKMEFELNEMNLLGKVNSQLSILANDFRVFNSKIFSEKIGVNSYSLQTPDKVEGTRDYFELTHLNESIFFGSSKPGEITLPSKGLFNELLNHLQVPHLGEACLIQVNFKDIPDNFITTGDKGTEDLAYQLFFLDKDGEVGRDINPSTTHAFIYGEGAGIFNIKVGYLDGRYDYLQTYCSPGTLLIEQL